MKKTIMVGIMSLATVSLLCGCDDFGDNRGNGQGRIMPLIGLDTDMLGSGARISPAARADGEPASVSVNDLSVTLEKTDGDYARTWESVDAFVKDCETTKFSVGEYTLSAWCGDRTSVGFDVPAYYGATALTVKDDRASEVGLTASMAKAMFSFTYTDAFTKYMSDWSVSVGGVDVAASETRPAYVLPGETDVKLSFTTVAGQKAVATVATVNALAKHHYKVTVDLNGGEVGDAALKIDWDETLETETVEIMLEGLFNTEAPSLTPDGFTPGQPLSFVEGFAPEAPVKLNIVAMGGLKSVLLETASAGLKNWPESVELIGASASVQQTLTDKGLATRGLWHNPDCMAQIDFTGVLKNIITNPDDNTTTFTVKVTDNYGREESIAIDIVAESLVLVLDPDNEAFYSPGEPISIILEFNGPAPADNVTLSYLSTDTKRFRPVADWSAQALGSNRYELTVNGFTVNEDIHLKAECASAISECIIRAPRFIVRVNESDVYSNRAAVSVTDRLARAAVDLASLDFVVSQNGSDVAVPGNVESDSYKITELTPGTEYKVRINHEERSNIVKFTTEAELQFPNSNLESWYSENAYTGQALGIGQTDIKRWFATDWSTRNPMTTAQSSGTTCYYTSFSGTVPVDTERGKSAEISTLGYGTGSTFSSGSGSGNNKYVAAGMLFVGDYKAASETSETISYGKPFEARPSAFNFWYKFAPVSGESFKAHMVVENRNGDNVTELGRGELISSDAVSDFTQASVNINYTDTSLKATHAYIVFLSSTADSPAYVAKTGSKGLFAGYADSRRVGSVLTVDDIELIY